MEWANSIQGLLGAIPVSLLLLFFIRYTLTSLNARLDAKVSQGEHNIQVENLKEDIKQVNGDMTASFNKILKKLDDQSKDNGDLKVEVAKLTQRVTDLVQNGVKHGKSS